MKYLNYAIAILFVSIVVIGCDQQADVTGVAPSPGEPGNLYKVDVGTAGSNVSAQTLYAGQTINAGTVSYDDIDTNNDNTDDALKITYSTTNGWELTEIHFFIGSSLSSMPTTRSGNPQLGLFPYTSGNIVGQTSYEIIIPFSAIGFSCPGPTMYYVAAHASLRKLNNGVYQTETGWGDGQRLVQRGNWAMHNTIFITCDDNPGVSGTTETAFAYSDTYGICFQNFSEFISNPNRWGWTNGPLPQGNYSFPLYAGAAQCDISKGTLVGTVSVNYTGSTATVTYTLSGSNPTTGMPYTLKEAHAYVGSAQLPWTNAGGGGYTISPGQYPKKAEDLSATSYTFTFNNLSGNVYVIAHASVLGFPVTNN